MCVVLLIFICSTKRRCILAFSGSLDLLLDPMLFAMQKVLITGRWLELMQLYLWLELVSDQRFFCEVMMWSSWRCLLSRWEKKVWYLFFWNQVDVALRLFSWRKCMTCFPLSFGTGFKACGPRCLWLLCDLVSGVLRQPILHLCLRPLWLCGHEGHWIWIRCMYWWMSWILCQALSCWDSMEWWCNSCFCLLSCREILSGFPCFGWFCLLREGSLGGGSPPWSMLWCLRDWGGILLHLIRVCPVSLVPNGRACKIDYWWRGFWRSIFSLSMFPGGTWFG